MLLVALSFLYVVFTTINFGACISSIFKTRHSDFSVVSVLGLFGVSVFTSIWAIFYRVNWEFHIALLLVNILLLFVFKNAVVAHYRLLRIRFLKLPKVLKWLFFANAVLILAKSAATPYVLDNESYYIQTVKWLNEYGFVKGLANLHLFLAQTSGWHIAQSAFSFSFLYPNFNDLSGYCLLLANLYAVFRLHDYDLTKSRIALVVGLLPVANIFLLQFSGAPATDIPIFFLTFLCIDVFFCHFENPSRANFSLLAILVLFALYIKVTAFAIVIFPLFLLFSDFVKLMSKRVFFLGLLVLALYAIRNAVASGMPLFPLPYAFGFHPDYAVPRPITDFFFIDSRSYVFGMSKSEYTAASFWEIFVRWLRWPKMHGLFNTSAIAVAVLSPVFIARSYPKKPMWIAYLAFIVQLALLLWISPQFRFFLPFVSFFAIFIATCLVRNWKAFPYALSALTLACAVPLFVPVKFDAMTNNKYANRTTPFCLRQVVFPHSNSRSDTAFEAKKVGNLRYFSPVDDAFLWNAGDGNLPCVNKKQVKLFGRRFGFVPQMRGRDLGDGFYSKPVRKRSGK